MSKQIVSHYKELIIHKRQSVSSRRLPVAVAVTVTGIMTTVTAPAATVRIIPIIVVFLGHSLRPWQKCFSAEPVLAVGSYFEKLNFDFIPNLKHSPDAFCSFMGNL